jgi:hypothetical protein
MSELAFPFKFNVVDETYTANLLPANNVLIVCDRTGEQYFSYSKEIILEHIRLGNWQMLMANKKEQDPDVVIKQSDYDSLVDEINMLRELVAEITLETDYTALGQQASTYRVLNEKMLKHQSYKQGDGGSTREGELLGQLDTLFAAYDSLASGASNTTFKHISEMTLEDWRQAERERWVFQTEHQGLVTVRNVDSNLRDLIPLLLESGEGNTWYVGLDGGDIDQEGWTVVKRVK